MEVFILLTLVFKAWSLQESEMTLSVDYFLNKNVKFVAYFSCENQFQNKRMVKAFMKNSIRTSTIQINETLGTTVQKALHRWNGDIGVLVDGSCDNTNHILNQASLGRLFHAHSIWMVLVSIESDTVQYINEKFQHLNLSVDADIVVVGNDGGDYTLTDVFNFGRIQGNNLEITSLGSWSTNNGLNLRYEGFKYYRRWDFHSLTLRAISVMGNNREQFKPELLTDLSYTPGITAMTKITSQLLNLIKERHNIRFNYTVADRWIGSPDKNATLSVSKSLLWEEQDLSSTCSRMFPQWLNWLDVCFPPTTVLQTKFYYLIPDKGVGDYENRFLAPLSAGVWWSTLAAGGACAAVLGAGAIVEMRARPGMYAIFSVYAVICQQDFEDGEPEKKSSQGRKMTLLVVGVTSMLLYNYYTSSVVSWLLSAAPPTIGGLDGLINSDLKLAFEDVGYNRGWLEVRKDGFAFYFSGYKNLKEDELREKKVTRAKQTGSILQPIEVGVELIRTGEYAYHTEPNIAAQAVPAAFSEDELCRLGQLQMMRPSPVYVLVQRHSPYKQFLVWSLMRLAERGHFEASRRRFAGVMPACSGRRPRALALGQAAPAFLLLARCAALSLVILLLEILLCRFQKSRQK